MESHLLVALRAFHRVVKTILIRSLLRSAFTTPTRRKKNETNEFPYMSNDSI